MQENVSPGWMVALRVSSATKRLSPRYLIMHILSGNHPSLRREPTERSEENTAVEANSSESPDRMPLSSSQNSFQDPLPMKRHRTLSVLTDFLTDS